MTAHPAFLRRLVWDDRGTALIETAIVAPVLILMAIGTFETSKMVARQSELQSSAEQATEIALAIVPDTPTELQQIKQKLMDSSGLPDARVSVTLKYRCGTGAIQATEPACSEESLNEYIAVDLSDEYQPIWTQYGFAKSFEYHVNRTVQIA